MSDPTENEELNEELSTEELKSVSGGFVSPCSGFKEAGGDPDLGFTRLGKTTEAGQFSPKGSGSGLTANDWSKLNLTGHDTMGADAGQLID